MSQVFKVLAQKLSSGNNEVNTEKTNLLLQYFESSPFYAWTAWQYLSENSQPAVQDYLFSRLNELGEDAIEKFLLQFVYLAVNKPGQVPEATVIKLCSKSFAIAIKAHWLFTALCQDHPKNKTLESLRERTRRAAVERNRGILSPNRSQPLSPPFSPSTSLMLSHMGHAVPDGRDPPAVTPPDHIVMSPQQSGLVTVCTSPPAGPPGLTAADLQALLSARRAAAAETPAGAQCLLPHDSWSAPAAGLMGAGPPLAVRVPDTAAAAKACLSSNSSSSWAPVRRKVEGGPPSGSAAESDGRCPTCGDSLETPTVSSADTSRQGFGPDSQGHGGRKPDGVKAAGKTAPASAAAVASGEKEGGARAATAAAAAAKGDIPPERYKALRAELGEGEQVTQLLERSQQQGRAVVADVLSEDERPTSPLTRLKYDKFDATLEVVDLLCEASITVAGVPQAERTNALRWALEEINTNIAGLGSGGVAIWYPMGRACDRILRLTANEAVVLTSREKAPYLLYIEVQEDHPEGSGDPQQGTSGDAAGTLCGSGPHAPGDASGQPSGGRKSTSSGPGGDSPPQPLAVEFGRRETYGIALMEMGAQHQQHFMRTSPARTAPPSLAASMMGGAPAPPPPLSASMLASAFGAAAAAVSAAAASSPSSSPLRNPAAAAAGSASSAHILAPTTEARGPPVASLPSLSAPSLAVAMSPLSSPTRNWPSQSQPQLQPQQQEGEVHLPQPQPDPRVAYSPVPASPTPVHVRSPSYVTLLEEDAEARAVAAASAAASTASASAVGCSGPLTPRGAAAACLTIPTRSASNSNIAAAVLAAMAASNASNVAADAADASQRSSEGGNTVALGSAPSVTGRQPVTPRLASGSLPPRPPGGVPAGAISPIHAAKEAQAGSAAVSTNSISPTRRLKRSLGQDEGAALAAAVMAAGPLECGLGTATLGDVASTAAAAAVAAATVTEAPPPPPKTLFIACSAASAAQTSSSLADAAAVAAAPPPLQQQQLQGGVHGVESRSTTPVGGVSDLEAVAAVAAAAASMHVAGMPRLHGAELAEAQELLLAAGLLSPASRVTPDPVIEGKLDNAMAAFQGTAPLVRVQIRVLPQRPRQPSVGGASVAGAGAGAALTKPPSVPSITGGATAGSVSGGLSAAQRSGDYDGGVSGGGASDAGTTAGRGASPPVSGNRLSKTSGVAAGAPPPPPQQLEGPGPVEKSKTMTLLSRFGLCRKPTTDDDTFVYPSAPGLAAGAVPPAPSQAGTSSGGAAAAVPPAADAATAAGTTYTPGGRPYGSGGVPTTDARLVEVVFEVTGGINLAIPSPHGKGKHARTPSHVAMEQLADKYKVDQLPPPYPSGPPYMPLYPGGGGGGGSNLANHSVQELSGEEGEGAPVDRERAGKGSSRVPAAGSGAVPSSAAASSLTRAQDAASAKRVMADQVRRDAGHGSARSAAGSPHGATGLEGTAALSDERAAAAKAKSRQTASEGGATAGSSSGPVSGPAFLNRIMSSRSGSQQQQQQPHSQAEGAAATAPLPGPSPRGGSPVRGAAPQGPIAAAAASGSIKRRWLGGGSCGSGGGTAGLASQDTVPGSTSVGGAGAPLATAPSLGSTSSFGLPTGVKVTDGRQERELLEERRKERANAVYGDPWATTVQRIRNESPYGWCKGWALRRVIVKCGDDCRQEQLALQLVRTFGEIFREANLPLWVRYYEVLVTSNKTALIEMVPDTLSIHGIKARSPPGTSLSDHFFAKFGRPGTQGCIDAQRRFTESLAAYSLICYLLQIKDRHNGNILMCRDGRIVHIDFGFLLSNSPGGVNFESAPFKLTREMLEVMESNSDGKPSEMFDYFKVLMIQGFLAVRKNSDRILLLLKMMSKSGFPCFKAGERAIRNVEKRLQLPLTEVQCVPHVLHLIAESLDAWRTRQYDYYQRLLNGIL